MREQHEWQQVMIENLIYINSTDIVDKCNNKTCFSANLLIISAVSFNWRGNYRQFPCAIGCINQENSLKINGNTNERVEVG